MHIQSRLKVFNVPAVPISHDGRHKTFVECIVEEKRLIFPTLLVYSPRNRVNSAYPVYLRGGESDERHDSQCGLFEADHGVLGGYLCAVGISMRIVDGVSPVSR